MASRRDQILAALKALLDAPDPAKPAGLTIERYRTVPLPASLAKALLIYPIEETVAPIAGRFGLLCERRCRVQFEVRLDCDEPNAVPDEELDPILTWALKKVLADPQLGGLCTDVIEKGTGWSAVTQDQPYAAAALQLEAVYQTRRDNPEVEA